MNLKKRLKKFFALNRSANDGFTLVELIVVIAILGILAGVGTVAYSGYIKKAQTAADEILLDSLNTAFAAACIENGVDSTQVSASGITIGSDKTVAKTDIVVTNPSAKATAIQDAFDKYYEGGEFKVYTALTYANGMFDAGVGLAYTDANGNTHYISISKEQAEALNRSTFMLDDKLGAEGLTEKLGEVSDFAALIYGDDDAAGGDAYSAVLSSDAFQNALVSYLGATDVDDAMVKLGELSGDDNDKIDTIMANATILFAAQNAQNMKDTDIDAMFANGAKGVIISNLNKGDSATAMSQAALAYGMYTAYAYNSKDAALIEKTKNPVDILNGLDDPEFQKYMTTKQGEADLAGYLAGMNMITDGAQNNSSVSTDILLNGFATEQLTDLLKEATGN